MSTLQLQESKSAIARRQLLEAEASTVRALEAARLTIGELEQEIRELRQSVNREGDRIYTEREFAQLFKVSEQTIKRLRLAGRLKPLYVGTLPRYSHNQHFIRAADIFGSKRKKAAA